MTTNEIILTAFSVMTVVVVIALPIILTSYVIGVVIRVVRWALPNKLFKK